MAEPTFQPHRITKPIQLTGSWMWGLVALVSAFLAAARFLTNPSWLPSFLVVAAALFVLLFLVALFLMQTKFRPQLLDDAGFLKWSASQRVFLDFKAENSPDGKRTPPLAVNTTEHRGTINADAFLVAELEQVRVRRYEKYKGVFLVHSWRPSQQKGQVADVVLKLQQHGNGPLSAGQVDRVEYELGRKFFPASIVKENVDESFRLEVSAYSPMLCLARVFLTDGSWFELERYCDFEAKEELERAFRENWATWQQGAWRKLSDMA